MNSRIFKNKKFLVSVLVGVGLFVCAATCFALDVLEPSQTCKVDLTIASEDEMVDRIIRFFRAIFQAMISLFCKIVGWVGFRCG